MILRTLATRIASTTLTTRGATALRGGTVAVGAGEQVPQNRRPQPAYSLSLGSQSGPSFPAPPIWAGRQEAAVKRYSTTPLAGPTLTMVGQAAQWRVDLLERIREVGSGSIPPHTQLANANATRLARIDGSKRDADGADPRLRTATRTCAAAG